MGSVSREVFCQEWVNGMTEKTSNSPTPANGPLALPVRQAGPPPVRVRLRRINPNLVRAYPRDGEGKAWWKRLKKALGTRSSDFVNASVAQLEAAARLPSGVPSDLGLNAALAMIEAAAPKDEIEGALAVQMACTHAAAMAVLTRLGGGVGTERRVAALGSAAARLLRTYSIQVETLRRLRHGGDQHVRVEHIYINKGAQAVIGNVRTRDPKHETTTAPPTQDQQSDCDCDSTR
jgi:hypothetical protein